MDELVKRTNAVLNRKHKELRFAEAQLGTCPVVLGYPRTFMNRSGTALSYLTNRFNTEPEKILVVAEDLEELTAKAEPEVDVNPELEVASEDTEVASEEIKETTEDSPEETEPNS